MALFPLEVVEKIAPAGKGKTCTYLVEGVGKGQTPRWKTKDLYELPEPWDLPVVFAVRASMALPVIFKAIRIYRLRPQATVRDDLGHVIGTTDGNSFQSPKMGGHKGTDDKGTKKRWLAEELWLSDGGITSNFPVHLFDSPLPEWPTFGLNLGPHPAGFEHQDVWVPEDWQSTVPPYTPVGGTVGGFVSALVTTARAWRDVMQTNMPSTRGRVAWVRQRPTEGGTNLFMRREVIASIALRGALAGARLRYRYGPDSGNESRWRRHRWLRLRAAVRTLDELREATAIAKPAYQNLFDPENAEAAATIPDLDGRDSPASFMPEKGSCFWSAAQALVDSAGMGDSTPQQVVRTGTPSPSPELRQSPPM